MLKQRIAVLVSGGGTNLEALLRAKRAGQIPHGEIALVIASNPEAYALTRAENYGVAHAVANKKALGTDAFEARIEALLKEHGIDVIVLAGFLSILSAVHPSLIPAFCGKGCYGLHVHERALAYGVKVTGATVHLVNEVPDGGKILLQKAVEVQPDDTPQTLQRRVMEEAEWQLLPRAAELVCLALSEGREI